MEEINGGKKEVRVNEEGKTNKGGVTKGKIKN